MQVDDEFDKYELFIIWKLVSHRWWCNKHIDRRDAVKGIPDREYDDAIDAIDRLVKKMLIQNMKKQGRNDICAPKKYMGYFVKILYKYRGKEGYEFIKGLEFIK
jgi:hypothetical protein